jgi:hypothetical protein
MSKFYRWIWRRDRDARAQGRFKEWIADNLSKAGWRWGCVSALDLDGRIGCGRSRGSQRAQKTGEAAALIVNREDGLNADSRHRSSLSSLPVRETKNLFQWSALPRIRLAVRRRSANTFKVSDASFLLFDSSFNLLELRLYSFRLFTKRSQLIAKRTWQMTATNRFI